MAKIRALLRILSILSLTASCFILASCAHKKSVTAAKTPDELSDIYVELGTSALTNDDIPRAIENLRMAVKYNADNCVAQNHLGLALQAMGERESAKTCFERAVALKPDYSDAFVNLAVWYSGKNDLVTARHYYEKALKNLEYRDRYRPLTGLAQTALSQGNKTEARRFLYEALADNPAYCLAHLLMGSIYLQEGVPERATGEFKNSIKGTCANNIEGQYRLGLSYFRLKEYKKARTQFMQIMEQFPNTAKAGEAMEQLRLIP